MSQTKTALKLVRNMNLRFRIQSRQFVAWMIVGIAGRSNVTVCSVDREMTEPKLYAKVSMTYSRVLKNGRTTPDFVMSPLAASSKISFSLVKQ